MSDVVAVAIVTGAFGTATAGITGWVTFKITKRNAEATVAAAEAAANVERDRVRAEVVRPYSEASEHERKGRREAYVGLLATHTRIHSLMNGGTHEEVIAAVDEFHKRWAGVMLIDASEVRQRVKEYADLLGQIGKSVNEAPGADWGSVYRRRSGEMSKAAGAMADAMRTDVGLQPPDQRA